MMVAPDAIAEGNQHGTAVARQIDGTWRAVMLRGASGSGKSDLALRLLDRGWSLVADDRVVLRAGEEDVWASSPPSLAGRLAVAGLGVVKVEFIDEAPLAMLAQLESSPESFPLDSGLRTVCGRAVPVVRLNAFWPSAPLIVEQALGRHAERSA